MRAEIDIKIAYYNTSDGVWELRELLTNSKLELTPKEKKAITDLSNAFDEFDKMTNWGVKY
ncbi:unnamed protein product [marine sediment metagenome]|uniref:Uncharacterized protein n=1 Tax=marine sediment metagenome TaxID=412755 RepID=X1ADM0_9ZZZZ